MSPQGSFPGNLMGTSDLLMEQHLSGARDADDVPMLQVLLCILAGTESRSGVGILTESNNVFLQGVVRHLDPIAAERYCS